MSRDFVSYFEQSFLSSTAASCPLAPFEHHVSRTLVHRRHYLIVPHLQTKNPIHDSFNMTRSHKANDRDHAGLAAGTALPEEHLPRYFAKSGYSDADPKKTKKSGAGRGNWGQTGEEFQDSGFNMTNARRRSNSSSYSAGLKDFKTKFEHNDEPVFEEHLHGPAAEDELEIVQRTTTSTSDESSSSNESVIGEESSNAKS